MSSRRLTAIVAGLVVLLALITRVVVAGSGGARDVAVDTTGASAEAALARAAPTPLLAQVQPTAVPLAAKPLLVLNPRTVRQGASIGVWGSGFPSAATVAIYLKQEASDNVNPVTVVEADKNGQFGGVTVTVPDSVSSGSLIIQAKEYQGSTTAMATATVADGADEPQAVSNEATATTEPTPTSAPKLAAQPRATPQPKPTPRSEPAERPQPTSQPLPTPQPKPTEQPQPTSRPEPTEPPKPTEPPQPKPDPHDTPSSYTVQAGDSLSAIAEHVYGNANDWRALYEANRDAIGDNPNLIHPGTELNVPPKD